MSLIKPRTRGKQFVQYRTRLEQQNHESLHAYAAFIGEGVAQETLNLSQLHGYRTGGTMHVIVNNQIGFTTSPGEARSTVYASDVAKMLQAPIFHVNGEDPEAVAQVVRLGMDFRKTFKSDVIDSPVCRMAVILDSEGNSILLHQLKPKKKS